MAFGARYSARRFSRNPIRKLWKPRPRHQLQQRHGLRVLRPPNRRRAQPLNQHPNPNPNRRRDPFLNRRLNQHRALNQRYAQHPSPRPHRCRNRRVLPFRFQRQRRFPNLRRFQHLFSNQRPNLHRLFRTRLKNCRSTIPRLPKSSFLKLRPLPKTSLTSNPKPHPLRSKARPQRRAFPLPAQRLCPDKLPRPRSKLSLRQRPLRWIIPTVMKRLRITLPGMACRPILRQSGISLSCDKPCLPEYSWLWCAAIWVFTWF